MDKLVSGKEGEGEEELGRALDYKFNFSSSFFKCDLMK